MKDTARVLGRMYDAIEYRGFAQTIVEDAGRFAGRAGLQRPDRRVPPHPGAGRRAHHGGALRQAASSRFLSAYLGDARNNMGNSLLMAGAAILGMDVRLVAPRSCWPEEALVAAVPGHRRKERRAHPAHRRRGRGGQGRGLPRTPTYGSRWASPNRNGRSASRLMKPYQVNRRVLDLTGNPDVKFLHCLPAFHNRDTRVGRVDLPAARPRRTGSHRGRLRIESTPSCSTRPRIASTRSKR